jgi:1-acyl-sn-glycerol-3-phosphate acyltransferase
MHRLRALTRLLLIGIVLAGSLLLRLTLQIGTVGRPSARRKHRANLAGRTARVVGQIMGMQVRVEGTPPEAPFWLVSNHVSYVDVVLLMGLVEGVFVAKQEVRSWPLLGLLTRAFGTLYIDRSNARDAARINERMEAALSGGDGLVFFPEGTSTAGDRVLPFRSSLLDPAASGASPVYYAAIRYRTPPGAPPASQAVCWWGTMTFGGHFWALLGLPGFHATVRFGERPLMEPDRKRLAQRLRDHILQSLEPLPDAVL